METTDHEKESAGLINHRIKSLRNLLVKVSDGDYKTRILKIKMRQREK